VHALLILDLLLVQLELFLSQFHQDGLAVLLESRLLSLEVGDLLVLVAHLLVERVAGRVEIGDLVGHLLDLALEHLLADDLLIQLLLELALVFFELLLLPLLLIVEVDDVIVHGCDLLCLSLDHLLVVLLNSVVVHLGVALVADPVQLFVCDTQLPAVLAAHLAHGLRAPFTVPDRIAPQRGSGEGRLTQLAELAVGQPFGLHGLEVKGGRQAIGLGDKFRLLLVEEAGGLLEVGAAARSSAVDEDGLGAEGVVHSEGVALGIEVDRGLMHFNIRDK
jgi:hypothetical protein